MLEKTFIDYVGSGTLGMNIIWGVLLLLLIEFFVILLSKRRERNTGLFTFTLQIKILALFLALVSIILGYFAIIGILFAADVLMLFYSEILITLGGGAVIVVFIYLNTFLVKKHSKIAKHRHKFKKGDSLKCLEEFDRSRNSGSGEGIWKLNSDFEYEFVENADFDLIKVRSKSNQSHWRGEVKTFNENYFKKVRKKK